MEDRLGSDLRLLAGSTLRDRRQRFSSQPRPGFAYHATDYPMGHQRISSGVGADVAAQRLARRAGRGEAALPCLFLRIYVDLSAVRLQLVCSFVDWVSRSPGND